MCLTAQRSPYSSVSTNEPILCDVSIFIFAMFSSCCNVRCSRFLFAVDDNRSNRTVLRMLLRGICHSLPSLQIDEQEDGTEVRTRLSVL